MRDEEKCIRLSITMEKLMRLMIPIAATATTMLDYFRMALIPSQSYSWHKGQGGRIAVLGGSEEYTGAPYYAAMSVLKSGGDIASVICDRHAASPIKSYSPELIVYPYLDHEISLDDITKIESIAMNIDSNVLSRSHALVIGPGLGRNPVTMSITAKVIDLSKKRNLPLVIDGDGLWLLQQNLSIIKGYSNVILTPNANELKFLFKAAFGVENNKDKDGEILHEIIEFDLKNGDKQEYSQSKKEKHADFDSLLDTIRGYYYGFGPYSLNDHKSMSDLAAWKLAQYFGNVTILEKGKVDVITNGRILAINSASGSPRRCGGQGDILAGTTGLFSYYASVAQKSKELNDPKMKLFGYENNAYVLAAFGSSILTRESNRRAFISHNRATTTPNLIENIGYSFNSLFETQSIDEILKYPQPNNQDLHQSCKSTTESIEKSSSKSSL